MAPSRSPSADANHENGGFAPNRCFTSKAAPDQRTVDNVTSMVFPMKSASHHRVAEMRGWAATRWHHLGPGADKRGCAAMAPSGPLSADSTHENGGSAPKSLFPTSKANPDQRIT